MAVEEYLLSCAANVSEDHGSSQHKAIGNLRLPESRSIFRVPSNDDQQASKFENYHPFEAINLLSCR